MLSPSAGGDGNSGDNFPVGTILAYKGSISNIPEKWHLCDGTNGTPNLSGRFLEGVTSSPGSTKSAGLPNIIGETANFFRTVETSGPSGAFYDGNLKSPINAKGTSQAAFLTQKFDASRCSSVYKNDCTTVQPASYTVLYIMKIKA